MTPELDVVTDPSFLDDLASKSMEELRAIRTRLQSLENSLSYVRRLIQGRFDIIGGELQRRRDGGDAGDSGDLIGRLPDILAEARSSAPGAVRPPHSLEPDAELTADLEKMLEDVVAVDDLSNVIDLGPDDLENGLVGLRELEDRVSNHRRKLHELIDTVQAEVTRRYTTGEATVEGLLGQ